MVEWSDDGVERRGATYSATTQAVRVHLVKQCGMRYRLVSAAVKFYFTAAVEAARRGRSRGRAEPNITTDSLRRLCGLETGGDVSKWGRTPPLTLSQPHTKPADTVPSGPASVPP